jgi:hypothetical protein
LIGYIATIWKLYVSDVVRGTQPDFSAYSLNLQLTTRAPQSVQAIAGLLVVNLGRVKLPCQLRFSVHAEGMWRDPKTIQTLPRPELHAIALAHRPPQRWTSRLFL